MTFEQAVTEYLKPERIDSELTTEYGTYNKFCPNCFYRQGHPLVWCPKCGKAMVFYKSQPIRPTWRNYILRATTEWEVKDRTHSFVYHFSCSNYCIPQLKIAFPFIWYNQDPHCTTPKFIEAILKAIK